MNRFEKLKAMNKEETIIFLSELANFPETIWNEWFDEKYCKKCEAIECELEGYHRPVRAAFCELNDYCKFFPNIPGTLSDNEVIELWMNEEVT